MSRRLRPIPGSRGDPGLDGSGPEPWPVGRPTRPLILGVFPSGGGGRADGGMVDRGPEPRKAGRSPSRGAGSRSSGSGQGGDGGDGQGPGRRRRLARASARSGSRAEGMSNLALVRVDTPPQVVEVEPNDDPSRPRRSRRARRWPGSSKPIDVDHLSGRGDAGPRLTLDLEARRVGTSITPVVTVFRRVGRRDRPGA